MADEKPAVKKAAKEADAETGFEPETPSGLALAKVGVDGDAEEYAAEKKKHRWG